jgi:acyl carrier protein
MNISDRYQQIAALQCAEELLASAAIVQRRRADLAPAAAYQGPMDDTQTRVAGFWREILGVDLVGIDDTFFELRGDSLGVVQVLVRLRDAYGVDISIETFFEGPTIRELSAVVSSAGRQSDAGDQVDVIAALDRIEVLAAREAATPRPEPSTTAARTAPDVPDDPR